MPQALQILKDDRSKLTSLLVSLSNLGSVASNVITATEQSLTSALENLSPALEQLSAAGSDLPKALRIAGTYPFPLGTALGGIKGDYANLNLYLDLSLTNELCGVNALLCVTGAANSPLSGQTKQSANATPASSSASPDSVFEPTLIGMGG
jgi:phospholipid/cholesterol/gamma-HCH transport system substrate-binding protein